MWRWENEVEEEKKGRDIDMSRRGVEEGRYEKNQNALHSVELSRK